MSATPPLNHQRQLDAICDHFEAAWKAARASGTRPRLEDYLAETPPAGHQAVLLRELVLLDVHYRVQSGDAPRPAEYLCRFPDLDPQWLAAALPPCVKGAADPTLAEAPAESVPPRRVAGYEVLEELGRGGMSVVYKARQAQPNRLVALKMILAGRHIDPARRARLLVEADAIARLRHPHIVQIYEAGEHDGLPFLSLELVSGGSLADKRGGWPLPARQAAALVETLACAIQHSHEHGVVHRDLKPANVLLTGEGQPKITDFGLARHERPELTATGAVLGTPSYMAPEQAGGDNRAVGPAADVYGLGAILYELLTGRPPFRGATALETLEQVRNRPADSPRLSNPAVDRDLATICLHCLEKSPGRRYPSAAALADDLRRWLNREPIRARPIGPTARLWRWCQRRPVLALLTASVAVLVLAVAVVSSLAAWRLGNEAQRLRAAERLTNERLFQSYLDQARLGRATGRMGQRFASVEALEKATALAHTLELTPDRFMELRNEAIACLALVDLRVLRHWQADSPFPLEWAAFDAGLKNYTSADAQGVVGVRRVDGGAEITRLLLPAGPKRRVDPIFSPDGRFLAGNYDPEEGPEQERALVWDLETGRVVKSLLDGPGQVRAFSPDSRLVATDNWDGCVGLHDLTSGKERRLKVGFNAIRVAFRPDGKQLAVTDVSHQEVRILDVATGDPVKTLPHPDEPYALAWGPDGRLLAAGCRDRKAYVWDTEDWQLQAVLEGHQGQVDALAFSPAGELLASSSLDGTTRLWDPVSGTPLVSAPGKLIRFDAAGRRLAFHRGRELGVWEVAAGRECRQLRYGRVGKGGPWGLIGDIEGLSFGAGGRLLAASGNEGVRFWDVASGADVGYLPVGRQARLFFDAEGKGLYTSGRSRLRRWPVEPEANAGVFRIGPPRAFAFTANENLWTGRDHTGRLLALNDVTNARVLLLDVPRWSATALAEHSPVINSISLSPDGRLLAVNLLPPPGLPPAGVTSGVRLWDVARKQPIAPLPPSMDTVGEATVEFSPDGRWLAAGGPHDVRIWDARRWEAPPRTLPRDNTGTLPDLFAFSPDSRILAFARTTTELQLYDLETSEEVARLLAPDARRIFVPCFSPDGSRLAVATLDRVIQVWDLRDVRGTLRGMGLDWDLPAFPPDVVRPGEPLRVVLLPDQIEAENLKPLASANCRAYALDTTPFGPGVFSNDRVLLGQAENGGYAELRLEVPRGGRYALGIYFMTGPEGGLIEVSLDGQTIGSRFDSFRETVGRSGRIDFGTLPLPEGRHRLRFTAVGKDPRSKGHVFGVDCLELRPGDS
jgi:WD40 repeat protein/tRNA A-37 threonylcarbamoyl transferase component Bud32